MKKRKKIIIVSGARPNFMKIAVLLKELKKRKNLRPVLVHTGQHYDYEMSGSFFYDLEITKIDYFLKAGSGSHAEQTAKVLVRFEKVCVTEKPDIVIVVGDVNSTLACALAAKKLNIKVAHIEAGLRSFDMTMPEEINRILTDSLSDFLFITEKSALENLCREGKNRKNIFFVGNTMIDSLMFGLKKLNKKNTEQNKIKLLKDRLKEYGVVTLHRPNNVDNKKDLLKLVKVLNSISNKIPLVFPVHPRTGKNIRKFKIKLSKNIQVIKPLGYLNFLFLYKDAKLLLTDSGGIQEETTALGISCLTLRENTERPITVQEGTNVVIGKDYDKLAKQVNKILTGKSKKGKIPKFWDGRASDRIVKILNEIV